MAAPSTPAPALPLSIDSTVIVSPLKTPRARTPASGKKSGKGDEAATGIEWHALAVEEVFRLLETDPQKGITESEALHRQTSIFGKNLMTPPRKLSFLARCVPQQLPRPGAQLGIDLPHPCMHPRSPPVMMHAECGHK